MKNLRIIMSTDLWKKVKKYQLDNDIHTLNETACILFTKGVK